MSTATLSKSFAATALVAAAFLTGCATVSKARLARVVILADLSTPLTASALGRLQMRLSQLADSDIHDGDAVSLWILGGAEEILYRAFAGRMPARKGNPLIANPARLARRAREECTAPLLKAVTAANGSAASTSSPIWQALLEISTVEQLSRSDAQNHLVLISDLRQYGAPVQETASARAELADVDVTLIFIPRDRVALDEELELQRVWCLHLKSLGARNVRLERL